ncbi:MAG: trypsin-like peptidase domain-containing protein [Clostridium sp.]|jgi:serine protease Do|nr:trypsin-like peptidase domain-containing protein [Clostridium sp.]
MLDNNLYPNNEPGSVNPSNQQNPSAPSQMKTNPVPYQPYQSYQPYQTYQPCQTNQAAKTVSAYENPRQSQVKVHEPKRSKGMHKFAKQVLTAIVLGTLFGLFGGATFYGIWSVGQAISREADTQAVQNLKPVTQIDVTPSQPAVSSTVLSAGSEIQVISSDFSEMVEAQMPARVAINTTVVETASSFYGTHTYETASGGSGIIVGENESELLIVTNHHVVDSTSKIEVIFINNTTVEALIKGTEPDMDLAVLAIPLDRIDEATMDAIKIATLGDSDALKLGEPVIAIGNALGYGQSVTSGWVSALNRELTNENGVTGHFIQTDAAINPGNSGGALLNVKGEVIGINSNKLAGTTIEGLGFAIPISDAKPYLENLFNKETRVKLAESGYLGIAGPQTITESVASAYGMPQGLLMKTITEDSPADRGGLRLGDIIQRFEDQAIKDFADLQRILQYYGPGETITLTVMRQSDEGYREVTLEITLGSRPAQ